MGTNVESCPSKDFAELLLRKGAEAEALRGNPPETKWVELPGEREQLLLIGDRPAERHTVPTFEQHYVETIADLCAQAAAELAAGPGGIASPVLWYEQSRVVLLHTADEPRHWSKLSLLSRAPWAAAVHLVRESHTQTQMLAALRGPLKGRVYAAPPASIALEDEAALAPLDLVPLFRGLNFRRNTEAAAEIQQAKETFGRDVEQSVVGAGELPEEIVIKAPVYEQVNYEAVLRLALTINFEQQKFVWSPVGDCLAEARDGSLDAVRKLLLANLQELGVVVPIYRGTPNYLVGEDAGTP